MSDSTLLRNSSLFVAYMGCLGWGSAYFYGWGTSFTMAFHGGLSGPVLMMWPEACFMLSQLSLYSWLDGGSVLSSFWGSNKKII